MLPSDSTMAESEAPQAGLKATKCQTLDSFTEAVQCHDGHQCGSSSANRKSNCGETQLPRSWGKQQVSVFAYCRETFIPMGAHMYVCVQVLACVLCVRCKDMFVHMQASVGHSCSAKIMGVQVWSCMQVEAWL